jgi:predicted phosphodiesterase
MLTIIGDVHGKYAAYDKLVNQFENTVQLGDLGFNYDFIRNHMDPSKHKVFSGNHDHIDEMAKLPHCLGNYGLRNHGGLDFYFVRGGYSIDFRYRTNGVSWWPNEELSKVEMDAAIEDYAKAKPDVVITHEPPRFAIPYVSQYPDEVIEYEFKCKLPSRTSLMLEEMFLRHKPKVWIHGHFHVSKRYNVDGTDFISLAELEALTI